MMGHGHGLTAGLSGGAQKKFVSELAPRHFDADPPFAGIGGHIVGLAVAHGGTVAFGAAVALYYLAAFTKLSKCFEIDPDVSTNRSPGAYVAIVMVYVFAAFYAISWNDIPWIFALVSY